MSFLKIYGCFDFTKSLCIKKLCKTIANIDVKLIPEIKSKLKEIKKIKEGRFSIEAGGEQIAFSAQLPLR